MTIASISLGTKKKKKNLRKSLNPYRDHRCCRIWIFNWTSVISRTKWQWRFKFSCSFSHIPSAAYLKSNYILKASHVSANLIKWKMLRHFRLQSFFAYSSYSTILEVGKGGKHPFVVTEEIFKNGPVMENCLLGLESKQLYFWMERGTGVESYLN